MNDRSTTPRALVLTSLLALAAPLAALAQGNSNGAVNTIPTLDGVGFATLAGALAMAGSWVVLRRKRGGGGK